MSGLSYFQNGGSAETQDEERQAPASTGTGVQVKLSAGKGSPYVMPTPTGSMEMSEGVLDAMQQLYYQKLAQQNSFMEALKDAAAWTSGGIEGPSAALAKRSEQRAQQQADLFNIQTQLAQFKAAQEAQKRFEKDRSGLLGAGAPGAGASGAAGAAGIDLSPEERLVLGRAKNEADFNKLLQGFVTERTKFANNPSSYNRTIEDVVVGEDGKPRLEMFSPIDMVRRGRMSIGQATQAAAPAPAAAAPAPAAAAPAPAAAPVTKPTAAVGEDRFRFENLTPDQIKIATGLGRGAGLQGDVLTRPDAAEIFNAQPLAKRQAFFESPSLRAAAPAPAPTPAPAPAPAAAAAPTPAPTPKPAARPTIPEIKAQMEREKLQTQADIETAKEANKAFETEIRESASRATDQINTSTEIINLVSKNKNVFGVFKQKPGMASALGAILETGISAPGGHSIGIPQISEAIVLATPGVTKANILARDRVENQLNKTALFSSSVIKGQGQVTEYERRLIEQLVGSIRNTPENLIKIQKIMRANAEAAKERERMFAKSGLSAREFRNSQQYLDWKDKYDEKLTAIYNEPLETQGRETAPAQGKTKGGVTWRVVKP